MLALAASAIVLSSLWYTNILVNKIAREERNKIRLWAGAIEKKNELVNYTIELFDKLGIEEEKKITLWAEATRYLANSTNLDDYTFVLQVVSFNTTVPVITTDNQGNIKDYRNLDREYNLKVEADRKAIAEQLNEIKKLNPPIEIAIYGNEKDYLYYGTSSIVVGLKEVMQNLVQSFIGEIVVNSASVPVILTDSSRSRVISSGNIDPVLLADPSRVNELIGEMAGQNEPIALKIGNRISQYVFYKDSDLLIQLRYYPFFQLGIIALFLLLAYYIFSTSKRSEQNRDWVGMSKETAHQLGTPNTSLLACLEILKSKTDDRRMLDEMSRDLNRLEVITERFSKIGSEPVLEEGDLVACVNNVVTYLKKRLSSNIALEVKSASPEIMVRINAPLFEWVLENIIKNGADSMSGKGLISIAITEGAGFVNVDITDQGKGIKKSQWKTVFEPGYTTKKRGWGLGLSLVKRIVENYHRGRVFVKSSGLNTGTTFRIVLFRK